MVRNHGQRSHGRGDARAGGTRSMSRSGHSIPKLRAPAADTPFPPTHTLSYASPTPDSFPPAARSFPRRSRGAGGALLHVRGRQARRRPAAVHPVRLLLPVKLHVLLRLVPLQPARPRRCPLRLRQAGHVALAERLVVARRAQGYVYHDGGDGVAAGLGN
eukprot:scaffold7508_cov46-Isochrysis_galbana.AAC.1